MVQTQSQTRNLTETPAFEADTLPSELSNRLLVQSAAYLFEVLGGRYTKVIFTTQSQTDTCNNNVYFCQLTGLRSQLFLSIEVIL